MKARVVVVCTAGKRSDETEFVSRCTGRQAQLMSTASTAIPGPNYDLMWL